MKTEKEKLQAKSVAQLQAYAKRIGANVVDPKTGKQKTKVQLINSIIMLQRLGKAKKQISAVVKKQASKKTAAASRQTKMKGRDIAKDLDRAAKAPGKRKSATGRTYYERRANRSDVPGTLLGSKMDQNFRSIPNNRVFEVTFLGPTYSSGARVKIEDFRFQESKIIPFDYSKNSEGEVALAYLNKLGIKVEGYGQSKKGFIYMTKNFEKSIKDKI